MEQTKTVDLTVGVVDGQGVAHKQVVLGKRVKGSDLFALSDDPQAAVPTQRELLTLRAAITRFGTLTLPVSLGSLLNLHREDARRLLDGYGEFLTETSEGRKGESLSDTEVKLAFGFEQDGVRYTRFIFGNDLRVSDDVEADNMELDGLRRNCFLMSRELVRVTSEDGSQTLPRPLVLSDFEAMDGEDISLLRLAALRWRASFHERRAEVQAAASA